MLSHNQFPFLEYYSVTSKELLFSLNHDFPFYSCINLQSLFTSCMDCFETVWKCLEQCDQQSLISVHNSQCRDIVHQTTVYQLTRLVQRFIYIGVQIFSCYFVIVVLVRCVQRSETVDCGHSQSSSPQVSTKPVPCALFIVIHLSCLGVLH